MTTTLRMLGADDTEEYRRVRLNALQLEPTAFTSSWETTQSRPHAFFVERASAKPDNFVVGAFNENTLVGMAGGIVDTETKRNYIANVVGMWVDPSHRQQGIARKLLTAVCDALKNLDQVESIRLAVSAHNHSALKLYEDFGFEVWAREPQALRHNGEYYDELHLILRKPID